MTHDVEVRAITGEDQAFLAEECGTLMPAQWTTAVLSRCVLPSADVDVRRLTVGEREALLLKLRRISYGDRMDCVLSCPACGEKLDVELKVSDLLIPPAVDKQAEYIFEDVRFRLPDGLDQEASAAVGRSDVEAATELLLQRCIVAIDGNRPLAPELRELLTARMAELDPQAEMRIDVRCPACGTMFRSLFDAASFLMQEMRASMRNLYREVHILAWHYHWSALDILRMRVTDRRRYLQLIAEQLGDGGLQ